MITAIAGKKVERFADIKEVLMGFAPGDKVEVDLVRDGSASTVEVALQGGG